MSYNPTRTRNYKYATQANAARYKPSRIAYWQERGYEVTSAEIAPMRLVNSVKKITGIDRVGITWLLQLHIRELAK